MFSTLEIGSPVAELLSAPEVAATGTDDSLCEDFGRLGADFSTGVLNPLLVSAQEAAATWTNNSFLVFFELTEAQSETVWFPSPLSAPEVAEVMGWSEFLPVERSSLSAPEVAGMVCSAGSVGAKGLLPCRMCGTRPALSGPQRSTVGGILFGSRWWPVRFPFLAISS